MDNTNPMTLLTIFEFWTYLCFPEKSSSPAYVSISTATPNMLFFCN